MSLKSIFETVRKYAAYYQDTASVVPSQGVRQILNEKGWRFAEAPEAHAVLEATAIPYLYSNGLPLETVTTANGTDIFKANDAALIRRYEADKKAAARIQHGLGIQ